MIDQSSPISPNISMYNERGGKAPTLIKDVEMKENKGAHTITEKQNKNECINEVKKVQPFEVDTADEPIMKVDAHGDSTRRTRTTWLTRRTSLPSPQKHRFCLKLQKVKIQSQILQSHLKGLISVQYEC